MEMELELQDMLFRTYIDRNTRDFKTDLFTMAPVKTYTPPEEWNIDDLDFHCMIELDEMYFYDTERDERPLSYVVIPAEMGVREREKSGLDMFMFAHHPSYPCYPAKSTIATQIRVWSSDESRCLVYLPIPNCNLLVPLTTLFHQADLVLREGRSLCDQDSLLTSSWFDDLPRAVQLYLEPLQDMWMDIQVPIANLMTAVKGQCGQCSTKESNLRRHFLKNHSDLRAVYFCPVDACPAVLCDIQGLRDHLRGGTHKGDQVSMVVIANFVSQNCYWPLPQDMASAILDGGPKLQAYGMLHSMAGVAMFKEFYCPSGRPMHRVVRDMIETMKPRFDDSDYQTSVDSKKRERNPVTSPKGDQDPEDATGDDVTMESPPTVDQLPTEPNMLEHDGSLMSGPPPPLTYDKDLWHELVQTQIQALATASGMPPLEYNREEPQTLPLVEAEARNPDDEYKDMPPLEGDVLEDTASAAVSPLQSDSADTPVLPCPERPEEIGFTTETPEGPPSPCGVTFPVFPRGRDLRDRRPPTLLPLILQIFSAFRWPL